MAFLTFEWNPAILTIFAIVVIDLNRVKHSNLLHVATTTFALKMYFNVSFK